MTMTAPPATRSDQTVSNISTGSSRRSALVALIAFLTVVDLFATQAILPPLTHAYEVTPAAMGLAVNASTLGMVVASLLVAVLSRRIDRRLGVVASLAALSIPTLLLAVAPNLTVFAVLRIVQGLLMASAFTLTLAYLGETFRDRESAKVFAAYITGNVASNLFGRLMAAGIADHFGLAANFLVFAGLNLLGAVLAFISLQASVPITAPGPRSSSRAAFAVHLANPALRAAFAIGFCILFAFIGTFTFVNFVLVRPPIGIGMMEVGFVYLVFLPSIVTTPLAGRLAVRLGARSALLIGLAIAGLGLPMLLAPSLPVLALGLGMVAVGTFLAQAIATGFVGRTATSDRGAASGIYLASYFLGGLVGSALLGWIFDAFGWAACVGGVAVALLAGAKLGLRLQSSDHRSAA
jgi:predicted MFS family arabinose efflux permease